MGDTNSESSAADFVSGTSDLVKKKVVFEVFGSTSVFRKILYFESVTKFDDERYFPGKTVIWTQSGLSFRSKWYSDLISWKLSRR